MLRFLQRDNVFQKWMLVFFLSVVSIGMVITLIPGFLDFGSSSTSAANVYAKVGDEKVTLEDIDRQANEIARQQAQGRSVPPGLLPYFRSAAASRLVDNAVIREEAHHMGLQVSDTELVEYLKHGPYAEYFFPKGEFIGLDKYENMIPNVAEFEKQMKDEILARKLMTLVAGPVIVSPSEAQTSYTKENTKVKFEYAVVNLEDLKKQITPTDAELHAYYDANKPEFAGFIREQRKINYIVVNSFNTPGLPVTDADIQNYYNSHRSQYNVEEQWTARHILISPKDASGKPQARGEKLDDKAWEAARVTAEDVLKQIKAGGDFTALAKKYSDDPGSKESGGSLGSFGRDVQFVQPFKDAIFTLAKGQVSNVVKTEFGYHIIKLDDHRAAGAKPLDEVKATIQAQLVKEKAQTGIETTAAKVASAASKDGLEKAAAGNGLQVVTSGFFGGGETLPGIGPSPEAMNTIFSSAPNSAPAKVKLQDGYAIVQVIEVKPARAATFDEARARIEDDVKSQKAQELLNKRTQDLADRAHSLNDLEKAAKEIGIEVKTSELVDINGQVAGIGSLTRSSTNIAFSMTPGQISGPLTNASGPSSSGSRFNPGSRATSGFVLKVVDRQEPSADDIQKNLDKTLDALREKKSNDTMRLFQAELVQRMEQKGKLVYNEDLKKKMESSRLSL